MARKEKSKQVRGKVTSKQQEEGQSSDSMMQGKENEIFIPALETQPKCTWFQCNSNWVSIMYPY